MLDKTMKFNIIKKAGEINQNANEFKDEANSIIKKLKSHIDGKNTLGMDEITKLCDSLSFFTTFIEINISSDLFISRAVYCDLKIPCHNKVSRLSYIPKDSSKNASLGRMNKENQSMFYASLNSNPNSIGTVLSEVDAEVGKHYNILISKIKHPLNLIPIGIFDYFRRGVPDPFQILNQNFKEIYDLYVQLVVPDGMIALQLCDAFLTDVLKKSYHGDNDETTKRLYEVTSEIANDCLLTTKADGILYPSVKFEGFPNIILKPSVVDKKIQYDKASSIEILEDFNYGIFKHRTKYLGFINPNLDIIEWQDVKSLPMKISDNVVYAE